MRCAADDTVVRLRVVLGCNAGRGDVAVKWVPQIDSSSVDGGALASTCASMGFCRPGLSAFSSRLVVTRMRSCLRKPSAFPMHQLCERPVG